MTKTQISPDAEFICVFCDAEFTYKPYFCCDDYKGITSVEDAIAYYSDLYEIGN